MVAFSQTIKELENRLTRLVNEAIKYKFGVNSGERLIRSTDIVTDPSAGIQTYYFRDEAVYNKGPWKDFVDYTINGRLGTNKTLRELIQDVDKAVINGDVIVKLVDTPGQAIDWDDLRGWHYHAPGDKFNDKFGDLVPPRSKDEYPIPCCFCVSIDAGHSKEMRIEMKIGMEIPRNTVLRIRVDTVAQKLGK